MVDGSENTVCVNNVSYGGIILVGSNNTFFANSIRGYNPSNQHYSSGMNRFDFYQGTPYAISLGTSYAEIKESNPPKETVNNTFYHNNFKGITVLRLWDGVSGPIFLSSNGQGNYWANYNGTDTDGDGVGDNAYVIEVLDQDYKLVNASGIVDPYPLMVPYDGMPNIQLPPWASPFVMTLVTPATEILTTAFKPNQTTIIVAIAGAGIAVVCVALLVLIKKQRLNRSIKIL